MKKIIIRIIGVVLLLAVIIFSFRDRNIRQSVKEEESTSLSSFEDSSKDKIAPEVPQSGKEEESTSQSLVNSNEIVTEAPQPEKVVESFYKSGSEDSNYVELSKVNDTIWVHTTYVNYNGSRTPSNGLVVISTDGLILVDTPWNNEQMKELIKLSEEIFHKEFTIAVITHAHGDRIGGIDTLLENKVDVRSTGLTANEAELFGYQQPQTKLDDEPVFTIGEIEVETYYPGEGHSIDNITVWFPQYKVLFGGCLIKSLESEDKGNVADANVKEWPDSIKKVQEKYHDADIVVPGHGKWGSIDLLEHTLNLVSK